MTSGCLVIRFDETCFSLTLVGAPPAGTRGDRHHLLERGSLRSSGRGPHFAPSGPQIGFLQKMLRWRDYWLNGIDTGVIDEPMLRAWIKPSLSAQSTVTA